MFFTFILSLNIFYLYSKEIEIIKVSLFFKNVILYSISKTKNLSNFLYFSLFFCLSIDNDKIRRTTEGLRNTEGEVGNKESKNERGNSWFRERSVLQLFARGFRDAARLLPLLLIRLRELNWNVRGSMRPFVRSVVNIRCSRAITRTGTVSGDGGRLLIGTVLSLIADFCSPSLASFRQKVPNYYTWRRWALKHPRI